MPTSLPVKRTWCKSCQDFTIHKTRIASSDIKQFSSTNCETCDAEYQDYYLSEIPANKIAEQQQRYKDFKTNEFKKMMSIYQDVGATHTRFFSDIFKPNSEIGYSVKEDDAGQEDIWEAEKIIRDKKRQAETEFKDRHLGAQRNEKCRCGSDLKYKKCCLPTVEKLR